MSLISERPKAPEIYLDEHRRLEANSIRVIEQFYKAAMTLAAGGLSISLLFIEKVAHEPKPSSLVWLTIGWSAFTVSLLLSLVSFLLGYHSYRRELEILDELFKNTEPQDLSNKLQSLPNNWITVTLLINWLSAIALIVGASAIVRFAVLNTPNSERKTTISESQRPSPETKILESVAESAAAVRSS